MMRQLRTVARPLLAAARAPATRSLPRCVVSSTSSLRQFHQHVRSTRVVAPLANSQSWSARNYSAAPEPLTKQQVEDRVMQVLRDFDKVKGDKLTVDAHFINDLGLDSLDQVEITMALEDEFNIEIPDRDAEEIFTVRQAVDKIFANKNAM